MCDGEDTFPSLAFDNRQLQGPGHLPLPSLGLSRTQRGTFYQDCHIHVGFLALSAAEIH